MGGGGRQITHKFSLVMTPSTHSVLDLTIHGRHLAILKEKTVIRFFNDLTRRLRIALADYSVKCLRL